MVNAFQGFNDHATWSRPKQGAVGKQKLLMKREDTYLLYPVARVGIDCHTFLIFIPYLEVIVYLVEKETIGPLGDGRAHYEEEYFPSKSLIEWEIGTPRLRVCADAVGPSAVNLMGAFRKRWKKSIGIF